MLTHIQADIYSHGASERIIGKALKKYNIPRSKVVLLSKCYFGVNEDDPTLGIASVSVNDGEMVNQVGLSRKHIFDAVEKSVERLGTYIDVLQIHRLDRDTPREEIMKALNDVVEKGWVRYIGASSVSPHSVKLQSEHDLTMVDGRLGVPNATEHRGPQGLAQVHLDAELLQPNLPRRGARNGTLHPQLVAVTNLTVRRSPTVKTPASASFPGPPSPVAPSPAPGPNAPRRAPRRTSSSTCSSTAARTQSTRRLCPGWSRSRRRTT